MKIKPIFIAIWSVIVALAAFFLQRLFSNSKGKEKPHYIENLENQVSKEEYVAPDISKEEEAAESQTQKIDSIIETGAKEVEAAKKDSSIKETQDRIDSKWDEL